MVDARPARSPLRVAVLVSGEGTTAVALADAFRRGEADAEVVVVVADRPGIPALERAQEAGLATTVLLTRGVPDERWAADLDEQLRSRCVGLVVLAGFLRRVPDGFLERWSGRVINIHPSLLPRHGGPGKYGARVHAEVLADGDAETGATIHIVTPVVDSGPILWQGRIAVGAARTTDELRELVRPLEIRGLLEVVRRFAAGRPDPPD